MRISSTFKDYYDPLLNLYNEEVLPVYVRETKEVDQKCPISHPHSYTFYSSALLPSLFASGIISFCGKGYPYFNVLEDDTSKLKDKNTRKYPVKYSIVYDMESMIQYEIQSYNKNSVGKFRRTYFNESSIRESYKQFYNSVANYKWELLHLKHKSPIMMFPNILHRYNKGLIQDRRTIILNPCLRDFDFARIVDPYTAIQEIDMFFGNQLATELDPTQITDDKILAASKGFGHKYAFKKEPDVKTQDKPKKENNFKKKKNRVDRDTVINITPTPTIE